MARDECRLPGCDAEPGQQDRDDYRTGSFCSVKHDLKYDKLKDDARNARKDARKADAERAAGKGGWGR